MANKRCPTIDDICSFRQVSDAQLSPDGKVIAFVVGDSYLSDDKLPKANIWMVSAEGGEAWALTSGPRSDAAPRWSPDGQTLGFLSDREKDGLYQLYLLQRNGGEAQRLGHVDGAIPTTRSLKCLEWSSDGQALFFLMTDPQTEEEVCRREEKDDAIEFEKNPKYTRLYRIDIPSGKTTCLSPECLQIWEFAAAPSGDEFAAVCSPLPFEQSWYTCRLATFSDPESEPVVLYGGPRQVSSPAWSPDGKRIAFLSSNWSDRGVVGGGIFVASVGGGAVHELASDQEASFSWLEWLEDGEGLIAASHEWGEMALSEVRLDSGTQRRLWRGPTMLTEPNWPRFSRDPAGSIAVVREDGKHSRQVWLGRPSGDRLEWSRLTDFNEQAEELVLGSVESVRWEGADGWEMQGFLILPPHADSKVPCPLVTNVHGGPTFTYGHQYYADSRCFQQLAAQGIAVFLPNPRGSTGRGLAFAESNIGDMGGKDWEDIQTGIDALIDRGVADPERLGITGGSYGGYMTAWAVTRTDRFKAAVMLAGISDWRSFHGRSYLCDWDAIHYGGADPWDPDGVFRPRSPITHVKNVVTPTLILHGEEDLDVPVEQGYLFYRALKDLGVETELVVYPREPHSIREKAHVLDSNRRTVEWFTRHLLG